MWPGNVFEVGDRARPVIYTECRRSFVTGTRRCDQLRLLHWLPVRQRVDLKVATLVHRSLSGNSASYLADDCRLVADARERRLYAPLRAGHASLTGAIRRCMEQFTAASRSVQSVPAVTKDIFVWLVGPRLF